LSYRSAAPNLAHPVVASVVRTHFTLTQVGHFY
jgi:hypothetical protein